MIRNCALYLPTKKIAYNKGFPSGKLKKGLLGPPQRFIFSTDETRVEFGMRYQPELKDQLAGFQGFVEQLQQHDSSKSEAIDRIQAVETEIGVEFETPIDLDGQTFAALTSFVFAHGGFVFVQDSILTDEGYLVGPAAPMMKPVASFQADVPNYADTASAWSINIRTETLRVLHAAGFTPSTNMPHPNDDGTVRPLSEIAGRFVALLNLFFYVAAPEDRIPEQRLRNALASHGLIPFLTNDEAKILQLPRTDAHRRHVDAIGWRLENLMALAWIMGFDTALDVDGKMAGGPEVAQMQQYLPAPDQSWESYLSSLNPRPNREVIAKEDFFFCAHNAIRSAQLGHNTVPEGFDLMGNAGVVHERRHALTWTVSPDTPWNETILNT